MNLWRMKKIIHKEDIKRIIKNVLYEIKNVKDNGFRIEDYFDLSKLTKDDIDSIDVDYSLRLIRGFGNRVLYANKKLIAEEANRSYSIEEVKNELIKDIGMQEWQIVQEQGANGIKLILLLIDNNINKDCVIAEMESLGWSESREEEGYLMGKKFIAISFDPIFQDNIESEARRFKYLFHWTPSYNEESIMKYGLQPRSENNVFKYKNHVHLMKGNISINDMITLGERLSNINTDKRNTKLYTLVQVETSKIPTNVEIYYDPRYENGFYTNDTIPPNALTFIERRQF